MRCTIYFTCNICFYIIFFIFSWINNLYLSNTFKFINCHPSFFFKFSLACLYFTFAIFNFSTRNVKKIFVDIFISYTHYFIIFYSKYSNCISNFHDFLFLFFAFLILL